MRIRFEQRTHAVDRNDCNNTVCGVKADCNDHSAPMNGYNCTCALGYEGPVSLDGVACTGQNLYELHVVRVDTRCRCRYVGYWYSKKLFYFVSLVCFQSRTPASALNFFIWIA
jgi:hypothetical protein